MRLTRPMMVLLLALPIFLSSARSGVAQEEAFDLPAVVLTTSDLDAEGFTGYRIDTASPFSRADDVTYLSDSQNLDPDSVAQNFAEADEQGSYFTMFNIRTDDDDRTSDPKRGIETGVYLFADEAGARAGYQVIADESQRSDASDLPDSGQGLGDASEMTVFAGKKSQLYGIPVTQLELEIQLGRLVLEISTFDYESNTAGTDTVDPDAAAELEALAERLIDRADAALSGDSPNLTALLLPVSPVPNENIPYLVYSLLDGDPVQQTYEDDQALQDRVQGQRDRGTSSTLVNQEVLYPDDGATGDIWLFNNILQFESSGEAEAYLGGLVDRLSQNSTFSSVEQIDTPELGDEALAIELQRSVDGGVATRNELIIRDGAVVATLWIEAANPTPESPVVSVAALESLGAAQAECLSASGCGQPVALPESVAELTSDASTQAADHGKLPEASEPTVDDLLARVETFDGLSREHTNEPVEYDQIPPVGGMHNPVPQICGFYSEPVGNEHAVHSLEHGSVWITYDPDLPAADIAKLEAMAEGHDHLLISPYEGLPSPVVASAWGVQLQLDGVDDPYLPVFIAYYEEGPQNLEPGAACSGGTDETV